MSIKNRECIIKFIKESCLKTADDNIFSRNGTRLEWLIDLRPLLLKGDFLKFVNCVFEKENLNRENLQIAGMETAGLPILSALSILQNDKNNMLLVRKERKSSGCGNLIEGVSNGSDVIFVDDIFNSGSSAESARAYLETIGIKIRKIFTIIDYESAAGAEWLSKNSIEIYSIFKLSEFGVSLKNKKSTPRMSYENIWTHHQTGGNPFYIVPKSCPLLTKGSIVRGSDSSKLQSFNKMTGALEWEFQAIASATHKGIWSSPCIYNGKIYFGAYNGVLYCIEAETGNLIWSEGLGEWIGASPVIVEKYNTLLIGVEYERPWSKGSLSALDIDTREKKWEYCVEKYQHGTPAYSEKENIIVWCDADHKTYGIDPCSGKILWVFETERSVKYAPCISETHGMVAFASFDTYIYILDLKTGSLLSKWQTGDLCYTTPLFVGDLLFCGSGDKFMYIFNVKEMRMIKKIYTGARVYSSPTHLNGSVIFGNSGGYITEISLANLEIAAKLKVGDAITNKILFDEADNSIYISTYMNSLYKFKHS